MVPMRYKGANGATVASGAGAPRGHRAARSAPSSAKTLPGGREGRIRAHSPGVVGPGGGAHGTVAANLLPALALRRAGVGHLPAGRPIDADLSWQARIARMTARRSPSSSKVLVAAAVVPPGEETSARRATGSAPSSIIISAA